MTLYRQYGVDSGGWRPVRMSPAFHAAWVQVCEALGFTPVITQGGWMGDLAAELSGPTHDGDALDLRTRNLTAAQVESFVKALRAHGIAAWFRDWTDPHIHAVPGPWAHPSLSALRQWHACRAGLDGLAANGPDPHTYPLATKPPEDDMTPAQDQLLRDTAAAVKRLEAAEKRRDEKERERDKNERKRAKNRFQKLRALVKDNAAALAELDAVIAEEVETDA